MEDYRRYEKGHVFFPFGGSTLRITDYAAIPDDCLAYVDAETYNRLRSVMCRLYEGTSLCDDETRDLANLMDVLFGKVLVGPYPDNELYQMRNIPPLAVELERLRAASEALGEEK